jgi:hypothetical protein
MAIITIILLLGKFVVNFINEFKNQKSISSIQLKIPFNYMQFAIERVHFGRRKNVG